MQPTKIEWVSGWPDGKPGYSWNPIKGLCPQRCWYCYARAFYVRFGDKIMSNYEDEDGGSTLNPEDTFLIDLQEESFPKRPSRIFVCSTFEIYHQSVPAKWRDEIFGAIESHPEHTFFILTKLPQNIDRPMPENVVLGTTITKDFEMDTRLIPLKIAEAKKKFISFEPLLERIVLPAGNRAILYDTRLGVGVDFSGIDWIVLGRVTGHGKKHDPKPEWISDIARAAKEAGVPLFMKNNLLHKARLGSIIWPGKLIQEFPVT